VHGETAASAESVESERFEAMFGRED
jgi:hypothetical protein